MEITSDVHRGLAVAAYNSTWELLDVPDAERTDEQNEEMLRRAYASAYHWQRATGYAPLNEARSEWMLSRVWRARGNGPLAMHYAQMCWQRTNTLGLTDFDLAYSLDAMARAFSLLGDQESARQWWERAMAVEVANDGDRAQLLSDIGTAP